MELYYHVTSIKRRKHLSFRFSLTRRYGLYVAGQAVIALNSPDRSVRFDEGSDTLLDENDKQFIINSVMRNVTVG
jgi:hypothetical protein